jgi:hypothetical protein
MANTYVKIGSTVTVGAGGAAYVEFASIPGTYTDLVIKLSARADADIVAVICSVNGTNLDLGKRLRSDGTAATSGSSAENFAINNSLATASTFSSGEWYFPNYAGSTNKSVSMDGVLENNSSTPYLSLVAGLRSATAAITTIRLTPNGGNFVQYSTATLYGIKSS